MSLWIWAFIGGLAGTAIMDFGTPRLARVGLDVALGGLLGRWVHGFAHGRFVIDGHRELESAESPAEARTAILFHYIVGGGVVALLYPLWFSVSGMALPASHILGGLLFGLISVALTWFVQYPCFGFGLFGLGAPAGSSTILAPALLHTSFGLGVGIVLQLAPV